MNDNTQTLTAVSPAESLGTVDVTVTTPGGTSVLSAPDQFTYSPPPPIITTTSLPPGTMGSAYSGMLAATSGTGGYTWSITSPSPPAWLSLDPATGALTGTPTSSGTFPVTFEVTDANDLTDSATLTIPVFSDPGVYVPLAPVRVCDTQSGEPLAPLRSRGPVQQRHGGSDPRGERHDQLLRRRELRGAFERGHRGRAQRHRDRRQIRWVPDRLPSRSDPSDRVQLELRARRGLAQPGGGRSRHRWADLDLLAVGDRRGGRPRGLRDHHTGEWRRPLQRLVQSGPDL